MKRILLVFLIALPSSLPARAESPPSGGVAPPVPSGAGARALGVYPREAVSGLADGRIDEDLLRTYHREISEIRESLAKDLPRAKRDALVSEKVRERNRLDLKPFLKSPARVPGPADAALIKAAEETLASIKDHPVVGEKAGRIYDPEFRVGFCFGRAAYVHLELLRRGVPGARIAKVFAVGKLYVGQVGWDHHVAAMVRLDDGSWRVVDSVAGRVLPLGGWMGEVTGWDWKPAAPSLRFYVTDAVKFRTSPGAYSDESLKWPEYKGYFTDLAAWFARIKAGAGAKSAPAAADGSQNGSAGKAVRQ